VPAGTYQLNAAMPKVFTITLLLSVQVVWAQSSVPVHEPGLGHSEMESRFQKQMFERWALDPDADRKILARKQAEAQLREFYTKAHRFVDLWRSFAEDLNNQQTFNAKLAKEVSKAFHDLEKSDGWPVGRSK
jgi:hypothetical protein